MSDDPRDVAFENIGEMVRRRIFECDDGLEMVTRLNAGTVVLHVSREYGVVFLDAFDVGVVVRDDADGRQR